MHGNQWVLKIAVLKYYSVSKRGTTAKSNPKQATDPISLHTKFGDNSSNTLPLNERKPCVTQDIGRRTSDGGKSKNNISTPQGGGHKKACGGHLVFQNEAKNIPRQDFMVMNISCKFENASYNIILVRAVTVKSLYTLRRRNEAKSIISTGCYPVDTMTN